MMSARSIVLDEISKVAAQQKKTLVPFDGSSRLLNIGLDSLCFAILVARLEESFDFDPFDSPESALPVTVDDLVQMYERAVA